MRSVLALLLLLSLPAWGARTFDETDDTAGQCNSTEAIACASASAATAGAVGRQVIDGGSAGSTEWTSAMSEGDPIEVCGWFEGAPADAGWAGGDWVVRINVTTGDSQNWDEVHICRVTPTCATVQSTVGSSTGMAKALDAGGTFTETVSGSAEAGAASDELFLIVMACTETQAHGNSTIGITPSLIIDTPLDAPAAPSGNPAAINFPLSY